MPILAFDIGLAPADIVTLCIYLLGITVLGIWMGKTIHDTTDYFVGGRRFGKLFSTFFAFGAGTHSDQAVSVAAKTYTTGMSGIWYQWLWLFVTPFYWLITPIQRRCRAITTADYFDVRFGRSVALMFVFVGIFNLMVNIGTMLKGSGAVIDATTGGKLNEDLAIFAMTVMFVVYGIVGGLAAAVVTDFVQGVLTIVFSFILLPLAIHSIGGFGALHEKVAATFAEHPAPGVSSAEAMWSLAPGGGGLSEITMFYVLIIMINALVGIVAQPHSLPGSNASKTERETQFGAVAGNLIKRLCTVAWCLLGMCAFVMFPGMTGSDEVDQSFGLIAEKLLPTVAPGLIGIFIASLLASIMSSCDAFMITCSGLFTHSLYRPLTGSGKSEKHYVNVGRVAAAICVAGGVYFAYTFESVLDGLELFWKISALMGIAFWFGLFWRRTTTAGAWAGTLLAFGVVAFTSDLSFAGKTLWSFNSQIANKQVATMSPALQAELNKTGSVSDELRNAFASKGFQINQKATISITEEVEDDAGLLPVESLVEEEQEQVRGEEWLIKNGRDSFIVKKVGNQLSVHGRALPGWMMWEAKLYLPCQMIAYLVAGVVGIIAVSLVTPRVDEERLDRFYAVVRTPVTPNETIEAPLTLPRGKEPAPNRKMFDHPDLEIQVPSRRGVMGVLVTAAIAAGFVALVFVLVNIR